jgi:2-C-methyl-D-erythritol 2,4-cyclodiphosphate synthase
MRIGSGFDVHAYGPGDSVVLGGVRIAHSRGVVAHSDGDVVLHALCDAMLGAAGLGDIDMHFPDTDPVWKGANSRRFVEAVLEMLDVRKLKVVNVDITLLAQAPKVSPHRLDIRRSIAQMLGVTENQVNIKATTTEHLGFIGRNEGLAAQAVVLLEHSSERS